jgi:sialate O-acetylesterase
MGRFTPGKELKIFNDKAEVFLDGKWNYKIAAECDKIPETDFINWKPTGLYNAMTAPCHNFSIDGVIWYQGESNVEDGYDYNDFTKRMVEGYRKAWKDESLPFIGVQLPNFVIDQLPREDDWGGFRLVQNKLLDIPGTGLAVTLGLGEDNDLHPVTKEPIGERLALWASYLKYCYNGEYTGPVVKSITGIIGQGGHPAIAVELSHCKGLTTLDAGKGCEIEDMYILDESGKRYKASAVLEPEKDRVLLMCDECKNHASKVQWCCENTYHGALITNETEIPMSPFELPITERV